MTHLIDKDAVVAGVTKIYDRNRSNGFIDVCDEIDDILSFIDTLEVKDPYEQCIQYPSVKDGIEAHAETYSFNIESELFNQLTKEQQALWRKEIEQAVISGGEAGVELARDQRYKENLEVKEVDLDNFITEEFDKYAGIDGYGQLSVSYNMAEFYSMIKRLTKAKKGE